jgi:hypothetical protein
LHAYHSYQRRVTLKTSLIGLTGHWVAASSIITSNYFARRILVLVSIKES